MHPRVREALEQIDAAVFNGDTFDDRENRDELVAYVARWAGRMRFRSPIDKERPLSRTQVRMLRGAAEGEPYAGIRGQSAHGGAFGTVSSLIRRGLLAANLELTDEGRAVLAELAKEGA